MVEVTLPAGFLTKVSQTATDRAHGWDAVADVLTSPDATLVDRLRSGALAQTWRDSTGWLGEDAHVLTAELMSLDVYARGASRRTADADLADLRSGYAALVARDAGLVASIRELADLCREEAAAWTDARSDEAKASRVGQQDFITARLVPALPDLGGRLALEAEASVWRLLGRVMLGLLSADTGKDFQRAVLGEDRGRRRRSARG
ncbi:hypothetical protein SAMN05216410_0365 [Sanguibacter gelidistatuariae]|uniref:Uncharacterized protein n=1 Tax=Sanguibacter gelidistatuariae TaxID=1814289 RepID=A0A1G6GQ72_9MICO|nr:hypothetical protein [Sanguibacter gelidistatuariae]SDB84104.1 hypothetical protein SAMN05216410_0365 [Sanguibacter gelidistatuariae]